MIHSCTMIGVSKSRKLLSIGNGKVFKRFAFITPKFEWFGNPSELIENVILCSGQGFQYVGMFTDLEREDRITEPILDLMRTANRVLGYDIVQMCIIGPKSEIDKTVHCQPAVTLASLIGAELMKKDKPWYFGTVCFNS